MQQLNRALVRQLKRWPAWVIMVSWGIVWTTLLTETGWIQALFGYNTILGYAVFVTWVLVGGIVPWMLVAYFGRQRVRRLLRQTLAREGEPVCIECGFELTGNVSGVCPECGDDALSGE